MNEDETKAAANLSNPILKTEKIGYFLTLRNTKTNEQYMCPEAVKTLDDWYEVFFEHSMFSIIENKTNFSFPVLTAPSYGSNAWTCTPFHYVNRKNGLTTKWEVFVTLAICDDSKRVPLCGRDVVDMCVISPSIMNDAQIYFGENTDDIERACGQLQMACIEDAKNSNFYSTENARKAAIGSSTRRMRLEEKFGHNYYYDQSKSERHCLYASFISYKQEASTGSVVIPLILKRASFVLPCIQDDDPDVNYSVLQPHKFAYLVRITNLASGWEIRASVNLTASASVVQRMFFLQSDDDDRYVQAILNAPKNRAPGINRALQEESADKTLRRLNRCEHLKTKLNIKFTKAFTKIHPTVVHHPQLNDISDKTKEDLLAAHPDVFNQIKQHPPLWRNVVAYEGIRVFEKQLEIQKTLLLHQRSVAQGDAFIALYMRAIASGSTIVAASDAEIALIANTFYSICRGAAKLVVEEDMVSHLDLAVSAHENSFKYNFMEKIHKTPLDYDLNFDAEKIQSFLMGSCKGTDPENWIPQAYPQFIPDLMMLMHHILKKPKAFSPLLPGFVGSHETLQKLSEYILKSMPTLNPQFLSLQENYKEQWDKVDYKNTVIENMTYFLLTNVSKDKTENDILLETYIELTRMIDDQIDYNDNTFEILYQNDFIKNKSQYEEHIFSTIKKNYASISINIADLKTTKTNMETKYKQYKKDLLDSANFIDKEKSKLESIVYIEHADSDIKTKLDLIQKLTRETLEAIKDKSVPHLSKKNKVLNYIQKSTDYIQQDNKKILKIKEKLTTLETTKNELLQAQKVLETQQKNLEAKFAGLVAGTPEAATIEAEIDENRNVISILKNRISNATETASKDSHLKNEYTKHLKKVTECMEFNQGILDNIETNLDEPRNPPEFDPHNNFLTSGHLSLQIESLNAQIDEKEERLTAMVDGEEEKINLNNDITHDKSILDALRQIESLII